VPNTSRQEASIHITYVKPGSVELVAVKSLADSNTRYLGFLPASVFDEFANKRRIVAATQGEALLGYVAFSTARRTVQVVHLCVHPDHRRTGVAVALIERLSHDMRESDGLTAHCRIDFPADAVWKKLGFIPVTERPGRSKKGSTLRVWVRAHHGLPPFLWTPS
jgi:GNAT superfamily N-acetyltransferase